MESKGLKKEVGKMLLRMAIESEMPFGSRQLQ